MIIMNNKNKIISSEETLEILKPWCTSEDIMKLSGYVKTKTAKILIIVISTKKPALRICRSSFFTC